MHNQRITGHIPISRLYPPIPLLSVCAASCPHHRVPPDISILVPHFEVRSSTVTLKQYAASCGTRGPALDA